MRQIVVLFSVCGLVACSEGNVTGGGEDPDYVMDMTGGTRNGTGDSIPGSGGMEGSGGDMLDGSSGMEGSGGDMLDGSGGMEGSGGDMLDGGGGDMMDAGVSLADEVAPPIRASTFISDSQPFALPPTIFADTHPNGASSPGHVPLMQAFVMTVGNDCADCHGNPIGTTEDTRIAIHMWDDILVKLEFANGDPLFCDSCHQGVPKFLNRDNPAAVEQWMQENMVDKLRRRDGEPHDCTTCHGTADYDDLLDLWAQ